jgi:AcrR family transcriptional regulator
VSQSTTRATTAAARRRARRAEIVRATRDLFDARGLQDANIDDVARAVGVNRAIIYRHFSSKDELFALTLADYLGELDGLLSAADDAEAAPATRLVAVVAVFADYGLRHPAFVDCAMSLMRQPGSELLTEISEGALFHLGQLMATTLGRIAGVLRAGDDSGDFTVQDADLLATSLYLQGLGAMHLARTGFFVRSGGGAPELVPADGDRVRRLVVDGLVAAAGGRVGVTRP